MSDSEHSSLSSGTKLNQTYKIIELLEERADCSIYSAFDEARDKEVWVKILDTMHDISLREEFQLEAKVLGRIRHPNVIKIYDFGIAESGQIYMVLESLKGKRLSKLVNELGAMDFPRALPIFAQLCDGLYSAHKLGIIHRELKPSCVFLSAETEGNQFVKITDFHRAVMLESETEGFRAEVLAAGIIPDQEPCYLSPEHILAQATSQQSDIYCLGLLIFEVLTGSPAFTGKQVKTLMREHEFFEPDKLSERRPDIEFPHGLQELLSRALEKYPHHRYKTIDEFKNALVFQIGAESAEKLDSLMNQARAFLFRFLN